MSACHCIICLMCNFANSGKFIAVKCFDNARWKEKANMVHSGMVNLTQVKFAQIIYGCFVFMPSLLRCRSAFLAGSLAVIPVVAWTSHWGAYTKRHQFQHSLDVTALSTFTENNTSVTSKNKGSCKLNWNSNFTVWTVRLQGPSGLLIAIVHVHIWQSSLTGYRELVYIRILNDQQAASYSMCGCRPLLARSN